MQHAACRCRKIANGTRGLVSDSPPTVARFRAMESNNKPEKDAHQSAQVWAKYSSLSLQWAVVFLIAAWLGSTVDDWLQTKRPYFAALATILAVIWVMRSLVHSLSDQTQTSHKRPEREVCNTQSRQGFWHSDRIFWIAFIFIACTTVLGIEVSSHFFTAIDRVIFYPIFLAEALPVASMFITLYPIRQHWPDFFNRSKVLISLVFIGLHFLYSLLILIVLLLKKGSLTPDYAIPFLVFFFVFLCVLFVGIFSILRPISKIT